MKLSINERLYPPKHGSLKVWWIPQVPMKAFMVKVESLAEAKLILDAFALYDQFQLANNIKPDYANAGGLSVFDRKDTTDHPSGSWVDWHSEDGEDIDFYTLEQLRANPPKWENDIDTEIV